MDLFFPIDHNFDVSKAHYKTQGHIRFSVKFTVFDKVCVAQADLKLEVLLPQPLVSGITGMMGKLSTRCN